MRIINIEVIPRWARKLFQRQREGQTLVFMALASIVLFGALGLAIDGGYNFMQRRTMQNAADAAALQGALGVYNNTPAATLKNNAQQLAIRNGLQDPAGGNTTFTCRFLDNSDIDRGDCANYPTNGTPVTGVRITVTETHPTFAMRVLGIATSHTGATASAHVMSPYMDAPIIVCGFKTGLAPGEVDDDHDEEVEQEGNKKNQPTPSPPPDDRFSVLENVDKKSGVLTSTPAQLNPAAIGKNFVIHAPNSVKQYQAGCDTQTNSSRFQGVHGDTTPFSAPGYVDGDHGNHGRNVDTDVIAAAVEPCDATKIKTVGCKLILPIGDNASIPTGNGCPRYNNNDCIHVVRWAVFLVTQPANNIHYGRLLGDAPFLTNGALTWTPGSGPSTIKLSR